MSVDNVFAVTPLSRGHLSDGGIGVVADGIDVAGRIEPMAGPFLAKMRRREEAVDKILLGAG